MGRQISGSQYSELCFEPPAVIRVLQNKKRAVTDRAYSRGRLSVTVGGL